MNVRHPTKKKKIQFSIRTALLAMTVTAVCLAIAVLQYRRLQTQSFVQASVRGITDKHVSSVGYANGRILWLRANGIDPHHPNGFDQWIVPIEMDMFSNDGAIGTYQDFDDHALRTFVNAHPHVRAIDIRNSAVTDDGVRHLANTSSGMDRPLPAA